MTQCRKRQSRPILYSDVFLNMLFRHKPVCFRPVWMMA